MFSTLKLVRQIISNKLFLLVVLIGIFLFLSSITSDSFFKKAEEKERATEKEIIEEDTEDRAEIENEIIVEENSPTDTNPIPTTAIYNNGTIDSFIYPNGSVSEKSNNTFTIESNDSASQITDWYKAKIEEFDMNTTSVVTTNTNGNVLNKLAAGNGSMTVEIEISRSNSEKTTKIIGKLL